MGGVTASSSAPPRVRWPGGARFALAIVDDTDRTTLDDGPLVYDLLSEVGIAATKTVWPLEPLGPPRTGGASCEDPDYLAWVLRVQAAGHEIGYHDASDGSSTRERTLEALDRFRELFGHDPRIGADHSANLESLHWCEDRLSGVRSLAYRAVGPIVWGERLRSLGHVPTSPYYWGDLCRERIAYWRGFTFHATNTLAACPALPYHDPRRPSVRWWYAGVEAPHLEPFLAATAPAQIDQLEAAGGVAILATHFGTDFVRDGRLDPRFVARMHELAARDAWFAPTSQVLDHLRAFRGDRTITGIERTRLEWRWVADQVVVDGAARARRVVARRRRARAAGA